MEIYSEEHSDFWCALQSTNLICEVDKNLSDQQMFNSSVPLQNEIIDISTNFYMFRKWKVLNTILSWD